MYEFCVDSIFQLTMYEWHVNSNGNWWCINDTWLGMKAELHRRLDSYLCSRERLQTNWMNTVWRLTFSLPRPMVPWQNIWDFCSVASLYVLFCVFVIWDFSVFYVLLCFPQSWLSLFTVVMERTESCYKMT